MAAMFVDVSVLTGVREFDTPRGMMRIRSVDNSVYLRKPGATEYIRVGGFPNHMHYSAMAIYKTLLGWMDDEEAGGND